MAKRRNIRRSEEQWRQLLAAQESSGKTQEEYCRSAGISKTTFWKWSRRLKARTAAQFIELSPAANLGSAKAARVEVEIAGGITLRIWS